MKERLFLFLFLAFISYHSYAQAQNDSISIRGYVRDNFTNAKITRGNAYFLNSDSTILDSVAIRSWGGFLVKVKRNELPHSCIIKITNAEYETQYNEYSLRYVGKKELFELPTIFIKRKTSFGMQHLNEVVVTATKVKMFYRGDTLVYNADAFNVAEGSMLDALIKQMPGVELNKQGEIFVNGRKVDNLLLNGKDFFRGKNKLMLENLPYYTVKEVKVYEQTTEKALALRDDRADKDFVMDVNLKREYSKGYIGNVEVGAGTEDAYLARLFSLCFTDISRLTVVGGANNLNMGAYSFYGDVLDTESRTGRKSSHLLTAELMTDNKRNKNVLTIELSRRKEKLGSDEFQETFHSSNSTFGTSNYSEINKNVGVSLSNKYTMKLPIWMESITNVRYNSVKDDNENYYLESLSDTRKQGLTMLDSLFNMNVALNDPSVVNARKRLTNKKEKELGLSQNIAFSKKMYSTDVIDFSANLNYVKSNDETDRFNRYLAFIPSTTQTDINEDIDHPNTHLGVKADVSYNNSRLLYYTDLKLFAGYRYNYDNDKETITDATSLVPDNMNSYKRHVYENQYIVGFNYRYKHENTATKMQKKVNISIPLSITHRTTNYSRYTVDTCITQSPLFFEPSISVFYGKWKGATRNTDWGFDVSTSLKNSLPDATQLITLPLTSDKINIYQGNARLKSPSVWRSSFMWHLPTKRDWEWLTQEIVYNKHINSIVSTYSYDSGVYTYMPDNVNGTWDLAFNSEGYHQIKIKKKEISLHWFVNSSFKRMKNYIADGVAGQTVQMNNDELHVSVPIYLSSSITKRLWASVNLGVDWRKSLKENSGVADRETWSYHGRFKTETKILANISLKTECDFIKRSGYSDNDLNKWTYLCDVTLSKSILKEKIGLKVTAIDIFHQYKSLTYVINERGIRETRAIALPSYCLFTVTYKFNKEPKKK